MNELLTKRKLIANVTIGLLVLAGVMLACSLVGNQHVSLARVFAGPDTTAGANPDYEIFMQVRVPRVCLAVIVGAALACAGVVLQGMLRNPLADPYILGISSGAGLGAMIAILLGLGTTFLGVSSQSAFAFCGAMVTVWLVWFIGRFTGKAQMTALLLAGVVVNSFFSAVIMFLTSVARGEKIYSTIFWLMGSMMEAGPVVLWLAATLVTGGIVVLMWLSSQMNAISFGEDEARALGVNTQQVRFIAFAVSAFITAVAVSLSGLIGFVGLIIPHGIRLVFGPDHRQLLPMSCIAGAAFLLIADTIARTVISPAQLPVGVVTAIAGGPFFLFLLYRYTRKVGLFAK
jgi:iron complex transport system permease protein